jgi:hypothetical protein
MSDYNIKKKKPSEALGENKFEAEIFKSTIDGKLYYRDTNKKLVPLDEKVKSFLELEDTPKQYTGNAGKVLAVSGAEDSLEFITPGGGADGNTWDMTNVAFVDPANGNNGTAVVGDGNLPFQSLNAAFGASNYVWAKPGTYFGTTQIPNGTSYLHCPVGVIFGSNSRIRDNVSNGKKFYMTGSAIFSSFSYGIYNESDAEMHIECDKFDNTRTVFFNIGTGLVNLTCNTILNNGFNGGAYGIGIWGSSRSYVNVRYFSESQHFTASFRAGFDGTFVWNCPVTRTIPRYTSNYGNIARAVWHHDSIGSGAYIEINTRSEVIDPTVSINEAVINTANAVNDFTFIHNGDIIGNATRCWRPWFRAAYGTFTFNGDLISQSSPIYSQLTGWGAAANLRLHVKNSRMSGFANVIGKGREFYFSDTKIEHITGGPIFASDPFGITPQIVYTYNCTFETSGETETFSGFDATMTIGCQNTISTVPFGGAGAVDSIGGFSFNSNVVVPKF